MKTRIFPLLSVLFTIYFLLSSCQPSAPKPNPVLPTGAKVNTSTEVSLQPGKPTPVNSGIPAAQTQPPAKAVTATTLPPITQKVDSQSQVVPFGSGAKLTIPAGAIEGSGEVKIQLSSPPEAINSAPVIGKVFQISFSNIILKSPIQVSFPLPKGVNSSDFDISIFQFNPAGKKGKDSDTGNPLPAEWVKIPSKIDNNQITAWMDNGTYVYPQVGRKANASISLKAPEYYSSGIVSMPVSGSYCMGLAPLRVHPLVDINTTLYLMLSTSLLDKGYWWREPGFDKNIKIIEKKYSINTKEIGEGSAPETCSPISETFQVDLSNYFKESTKQVKVYAVFEVKEDIWDEIFLKQFFSELYEIKSGDQPRLNLAPAAGYPGDSLIVKGENFEVGESIDIIWMPSGDRIASGSVDPNRKFYIDMTIPSSATPNTLAEIKAKGVRTGKQASTQVNIMVPKPEPHPDPAVVSLSINPAVGKAGDTFSIVGSGFKPDGSATITITSLNDNKKAVSDNSIKITSGKVNYTLTNTSAFSSGFYRVLIQSGTTKDQQATGYFEIKPNDPLYCLILYPGKDFTGQIVTPASAKEPVKTKLDLIDRCGKFKFTEWMLVNTFPNGMVRLKLESEKLLSIEVNPSGFQAGTYNGKIGVHYPGSSLPSQIDFIVSITQEEFKLPSNWTASWQYNFQWGKGTTIEANFSCTGIEVAIPSASPRLVFVKRDRTCPPNYKGNEEHYQYYMDRLTGRTVATTYDPREISESPSTTPVESKNYQVGKYQVTAFSRVAEYINKPKPYEDKNTKGVWQWEGKTTRWYDSVTGVWLGQEYEAKNFFTGTYMGKSYSHADFGNWEKGKSWIIDTTRPLGKSAQTDGSKQCAYLIPDVTGLTISQAGEKLSAALFGYIWKKEKVGSARVGLIVKQSPAAGSCVPSGTVVEITYNLGP